MNINRDYLIINDVKKSNVKLDNGSIVFYITDKNTQNIFVNLVINISKNDLIQKYANIENAEDYTLTMNIVKPNNDYRVVEGKLHDKEKAIFEFNLKKDCCDVIGTYKCELLTKCSINEQEEITTSNKITYKVKSSVLNDLDDIVEAPEYPLVIQLFDKLSDIDQYEEDRRANELARQLAEQQRQTRFNTLDADMVDRVNAMDSKMDDVEARISAKEQAVDKLIVDTKADIDDYKVAKDTEIDEYKTAKDTQINQAITNQDNKISEAITNQDKTISDAIANQNNKIDTAIAEQNNRIEIVETNDNTQNTRLNALEAKDIVHETRITAVEAKDTEQDSRLDVAENRLANIGNDITNTMQPIIDEHTSRLEAIEAIDVSQNNRLDAIEVKNQQQDDRLLDIEKVNSRQDIDIKCLYGASQTIDVTKEGNSIYLQNSNNGFTIVDEIKGNTLVNCNKEPDKELTLNGNINTQGYSNVTLTEGIDGGLVDVALEGNTMVNVCDQKDPVAITKSYTVETGNHVALQGEYDGKCRPVVTGNTLVNIIDSFGSVINAEADFSTGSYKCTANGTARHLYYKVIPKTSTTYTAIAYVNKNTINDKFSLIGLDVTKNNSPITIPTGFTGLFVSKFTTKADNLDNIWETDLWEENTEGEIEIKGFMILEGDWTNKEIPRYFTGLQSSFEDKVVTQEMVDAGEELAENLGKYKVDYVVTGKNLFDKSKALDGYDIYTKRVRKNPDWFVTDFIQVIPNISYKISGKDIGNSVLIYDKNKQVLDEVNGGTSLITIPSNVEYIRLNGLLTQKNTFQIEEGTKATPYEPYKEYKKTFYLNSPLLEGDTIEQQGDNVVHLHRSEQEIFNGDETFTKHPNETNNTLMFTCIKNNAYDDKNAEYCYSDKFISKRVYNTDKEGFYSGSDLICFRILKSKLPSEDVNGFKAWLQSNPTTVVYKLVTPQYEVISQNDSILCDSYVNGHLDIDSAVPIERVDFLPFTGELTYLYANTQYAVQFVSNATITADITLGGTQLLAQSIVIGLNRISITTPETLVDNKLIISGAGANISEVVVTDTDREFGYFEGMKSVGECEGNVEVVSTNSNLLDNSTYLLEGGLSAIRLGQTFNDNKRPTHSNGRVIVHYPCKPNTTYYLTAKGALDRANVVGTLNKDKVWVADATSLKYSAKNGVYSITTTSDSSYLEWYLGQNSNNIVHDVILSEYPISANEEYFPPQSNSQQLTHEPLRAVGGAKDRYVLIDGKWYIERKCGVRAYQEGDKDNYKTDLINTVYPLQTTTYESIDYNPLEVYSGTTHITTNSTIPTKITVKNHGFNCLLKPSTTYTISSNLGLNTVTTPSTLTEDCLRFMDTDTSDITTMKNVLVLEGDYTTGKPLPAHFSGIESAFEQQYDEAVGKYKVKIRVQNEDASKENYIEFYINEPLRGVRDVKDKVYVKNDKVVVERNCGSITFDGSQRKPHVWSNSTGNTVNGYWNYNELSCVMKQANIINDKLPSNTGGHLSIVEGMRATKDYFTFSIHKSKLNVNDVNDYANNEEIVKQWLQQNPTTVVYQLAEPTYEEVEYNDVKLFIESFKNSTLFYDSNIPVTSKLYYSYSVPIVDTVAQTADISNQQDQLIIDLATQVAVLEMMTM